MANFNDSRRIAYDSEFEQAMLNVQPQFKEEMEDIVHTSIVLALEAIEFNLN